MEKAKTFSEYLEKNSSSGQKETKTRRKTRSYSEYQTYRDLTDGTLNRDLEDLNKALNELNTGWKDASSLEETKKRLSGIVARLSSAKQYVTDYGEGEDSVKSVADAYKAYADILNGFGDIQSYYSQFANADDYDKRVGRRKTLYENATSAEDFEKYAGVGAAIKNPSMREAEGDFLLFGQRIGSKDIGNIVTYSIDNNKDLRFGATNGAKLLGDLRYSNLKDDEVAVYNYWLAKENAGLAEKGTAQSYLESMDDILNQREAGKLADALDGNLGLELAFGFSAGLSQFGNGLKNAFSFGDDYIAPTMEAYASQKVRDNLADTGGKFLGSSLGQIGYDTASTIGNMFPTILLSAATGGTAGPIVGVSAMGLSAAGNSYQELLNSGMNKGQARALSTVLGVWEGASEYFLGRIEGLSGDFVGKALGKTKLVKGLQSSASGLTRALLRFFDQFVIDSAQEGLEEVIQDIGSTAINAIFTGEWDFSSAEELAYSFTLGALSAAVMNAPTNLVTNTVNDIRTYRQGKNIIDVGGVDALKNLAVETAKESGENSTLGKYAENVAKKPTPTNVGILDQKINEAKNENNRRSIEKALIDQMTEDGVSAKKAKRAAAKLSEILLEDYNGGEVDLKKAMKNPSVKKVYDKVVKGEGSEIAKRDAHHTEVREGIIRDYFEGKIEKSEMDRSLSEKFSFTDDGATINTKTGEKITLAARDTVVSNEDGNLTLKLENGETVRASDISFSSKGEAVLYSVIADMGVGADTANTLIADALEADGKSMISVAFGIRDAYWYGAKGVNASELAAGVFTSKLTEAVRKTAYNLGKTEAIYAASKKTAPKSVKGDTVYEGEHRVVDGKISDARFGKLNDRQKSGLALAKILSKLGANVYVYETTLTERQSGKENGYYISEDGSIHIDLNSGSVKGEGLVAYTVTHEFVHFIEDFSPEKFKKYADLLFEELGMDQKSVSSMLTEETLRLREQEQYKNLGESKLRDIAYSEVVAKCSEKIFTDTDALSRVADRLAKTDRTLLQKIVDFFKIIISRLRGDYGGQSANSLLGDIAADTLTRVEAIRDIFADAAVDALKNYRSSKGKQSDVRYSMREMVEPYSDTERASIEKKKGNAVATSYEAVLRFFEDAIADAANEGKTLFLGKIPRNTAIRIQEETGVNAFGKSIALNSHDIRHMVKGHGDVSAESARGQEAITSENFSYVIETIVNPDEITAERNAKSGVVSLIFKKEMDGRTTAITIFSEKKKTLTLKTAWITKKEQHISQSINAEALISTPEARSSMNAVHDNSISKNSEKVNPSSKKNSERIEKTAKDARMTLPDTDSEGKKLSDGQRKYFDGTKVVDANGNLLRVYHGSPAIFTEFSYRFMSTNGSSEGQGFYFTQNKEMAEGYLKEGGQLLDGYLSIKKPLSDSKVTLTRAEVKRLVQAIDPTGDDVIINYDSAGGRGYPSKAWYHRALADTVNACMDYCDSDSEILANIANSGAGAENVLLTAKRVLGYDGYIVDNKYENSTIYVAFTSEQFKNADNLKPTADPDIRYSERSFSSQIDDVLAGRHDPNYDLYVGKTPQVLLDIGFENKPLLMRNSKVKEILFKHPEMSAELIKKIPQAIADPVMIVKSKTNPAESVVAITDIQTSKGEMIIPVWINQDGTYLDVELGDSIRLNTNFVASAYGRSTKSLVEYAIENDEVLYYSKDKKRVSTLLATHGLQLPARLSTTNFTNIISETSENVNRESEKSFSKSVVLQ